MKLQDRAKKAQNSITKKIFKLMQEKQSNLALSLDVSDKKFFFDILERCADQTLILKTHIDIIEGFNDQFINRLLTLREKYNFLIFEDRKFADIGNTVKLQYTSGIFKIIDWADIVNAHIFPGSGIIQGLRQAWKESKRDQGLILLPQMTSRENLFTSQVMQKAVEWSQKYSDYVIGFIGAAEQENRETEEFKNREIKEQRNREMSLKRLRRLSWPEFLIMCPGVKLEEVGDDFGQTYVSPQTAIEQGADIIIVGRGIYQYDEPGKAAAEYRLQAWEALKSRD